MKVKTCMRSPRRQRNEFVKKSYAFILKLEVVFDELCHAESHLIHAYPCASIF